MSTELFQPGPNEPICMVSYEMTFLRLGGGPDTRKSFWPAYREMLKTNQKTKYQNHRIQVCAPYLQSLKSPPERTVYYRNDGLTVPFQPFL